MPGNEWLDDEDGGDATTVEGEPLEVMLDQACQSCGERTVFNTIVTLRLPHFGKAMQTMYRCSSCGFRHSDVIMLENRGPTRCELYVDSSEALNSRVLRSNSGTIRIPEIGTDIEPATASESFVSNVEGVLERICRVIRMVKSDSELDVYERCEAILRRLDRMKEGAEPFHIVIDDPYGNSAIVGRGVSVTGLGEKEAALLETGEINFNFKPAVPDAHNEDE